MGTVTIEEIEGVRELDPGPDATTLIRRCLALRRKPLSEFTTEDLRIMLGQQNKDPRPFIWTETTDEILQALAAYCQRTGEAGAAR